MSSVLNVVCVSCCVCFMLSVYIYLYICMFMLSVSACVCVMACVFGLLSREFELLVVHIVYLACRLCFMSFVHCVCPSNCVSVW